MLSTKVVSATAARPSGPGSAIAVGMKLTSWRAVVPAVGSAWPSPPGARGETDESSIALLLCERARASRPCLGSIRDFRYERVRGEPRLAPDAQRSLTNT